MNSELDEGHSEKDDIFLWESNEAVEASIPNPQYSVLTEQAQGLISLKNQCALFCGGRNCKYDRSDCWEGQMAITGLFSHWVSKDILAMARPNTEVMVRHRIVDQFVRYKIMSVINLQETGEHASCGPGLEPSGFSYDPQDFMSSNIYFYNFACQDYGTLSKSRLLDMVRVMQFALTQGKVAIHCHAGLGRTGLLICCYLVFTYRMSANKAITYLRKKRPKSIQTRKQMLCVREFVEFLKKLWIVFPYSPDISCEFTLQQYMNRQRKLLHGYELRILKHIPQIIYYVCERLLELAHCGSTSALSIMNKTIAIPDSFSAHATSEEEIGDIPYRGSTSSVDKDDVFKNDRPHVLYSNTSQLSACTNCDNDAMDAMEYHAIYQSDGSANSEMHCSDSNLMKDSGAIAGGNFPVSGFFPTAETSKSITSNTKNNLPKGSHLHAFPQGDKNLKLRIANALCCTTFSEEVILQKDALKQELNNSDNGWKLILTESNPEVLAALMWEWLNRLQEPILRYRDSKTLLTYSDDPFLCLSTLEKCPHATIDYLNKVVVRLLPLPEPVLNHLLEVLLSHLTHHYICLEPCSVSWKSTHWLELCHPTPIDLINFFKCLLQMNQRLMSQNTLLTNH
ncbi:tyrosine phosphatase domain-containing 1 isoform X2 [Octopus vulgaris]|uniref:Tyrosine phosphatase domain-containing 1 isoform X2 n=2 Tax=Octopus vulgaris TaxID=6645 RepID=A0AA36F7P5_OCTVU|nr:tyrosine phosphatase domain-containing 1 isoform X2 [Octopus vulgaris]